MAKYLHQRKGPFRKGFDHANHVQVLSVKSVKWVMYQKSEYKTIKLEEAKLI